MLSQQSLSHLPATLTTRKLNKTPLLSQNHSQETILFFWLFSLTLPRLIPGTKNWEHLGSDTTLNTDDTRLKWHLSCCIIFGTGRRQTLETVYTEITPLDRPTLAE